jgi:hypothetical protein
LGCWDKVDAGRQGVFVASDGLRMRTGGGVREMLVWRAILFEGRDGEMACWQMLKTVDIDLLFTVCQRGCRSGRNIGGIPCDRGGGRLPFWVVLKFLDATVNRKKRRIFKW